MTETASISWCAELMPSFSAKRRRFLVYWPPNEAPDELFLLEPCEGGSPHIYSAGVHEFLQQAGIDLNDEDAFNLCMQAEEMAAKAKKEYTGKHPEEFEYMLQFCRWAKGYEGKFAGLPGQDDLRRAFEPIAIGFAQMLVALRKAPAKGERYAWGDPDSVVLHFEGTMRSTRTALGESVLDLGVEFVGRMEASGTQIDDSSLWRNRHVRRVAWLGAYLQAKTDQVRLPLQRIAKELGTSHETIRQAIRVLTEAGYLVAVEPHDFERRKAAGYRWEGPPLEAELDIEQ